MNRISPQPSRKSKIGNARRKHRGANVAHKKSIKPCTKKARDRNRIEPNQPDSASAAETDTKPEFNSRYQSQTMRPIISLAFVFPLILVYEMGAIFWGNDQLRSGIDQWLDRIAGSIGLGQQVILPLLTAAVLVIWHHRIQDHWKFKGRVLTGMILESLVLGTILFCAASACHQIAGHTLGDSARNELWLNFSAFLEHREWLSGAIASIGSGIYEELLFRLLLLMPAIGLLKRGGVPPMMAKLIGIFLVSLLFTSLHYDTINPAGAPFEPGSFIFRFTASIVFCFLFLFRGFGIAVGTHVAYDILAHL